MAWRKFGERSILRETYQQFNISSNDTVAIRFVLGLPPKQDLGVLQFLHWEQERFQDLQILNMHENMNDGKTYEYFVELARWYPTQDPLERPWDFAMKADDDTLLILPNLLERMRKLPRNDLYMVCTVSISLMYRDGEQGSGIWVRDTLFPGISFYGLKRIGWKSS